MIYISWFKQKTQYIPWVVLHPIRYSMKIPLDPGSSAIFFRFLCGLTVALALVPEAVAFALAAGLPPDVGLNSAWIISVTRHQWGLAQARWMIYFMENLKITWMMIGSSPILGNLHLNT